MTTEHVIIQGRPSLIGPIARCSFLCLTCVGILVVPFILAAAIFRTMSTKYVLTSSKLIARRGLVSRNDSVFLIRKVEGVNLRQGIIQRLVGLGSLEVVFNDGPAMVMNDLGEAARFRDLISEAATVSLRG